MKNQTREYKGLRNAIDEAIEKAEDIGNGLVVKIMYNIDTDTVYTTNAISPNTYDHNAEELYRVESWTEEEALMDNTEYAEYIWDMIQSTIIIDHSEQEEEKQCFDLRHITKDTNGTWCYSVVFENNQWVIRGTTGKITNDITLVSAVPDFEDFYEGKIDSDVIEAIEKWLGAK